MPTGTIVPTFNFLALLVSNIWNGAADFLRCFLAEKFLHRAIVPANAYQMLIKFQLPSSVSFFQVTTQLQYTEDSEPVSFEDMEGVPK